jgi:hypothetical protein
VLAGAAAALIPFPAPARSALASRARLSPGEQRDDLEVVRRVLGESHVGLHWYIDRARYAAKLDALAEQAGAPIDAGVFQLRLMRFVAMLRHGHTVVEPVVSGPGYRLRRLAPGSATFPLGIRVIHGRVYVAHDLSEEGAVGAGTELLRVNGQPTAALLADMEALISADGEGVSFKRHQLGPGWRFQDLLPLLQGRRDRNRVRLRALNGRVFETALRSVTPEALIGRFAERRGRALDSYGPAVAYRRLGDVGVLTVGSFYEGLLPAGSAGFASEFDRAFQQIAADGVRRLVLDLRFNEGGNNDCVPMLYAHIADRPFRFVGPTILSSDTISGLKYAEQPSDDIKAFAADPGRFVVRDPVHGWVLKSEYAPIKDYLPHPGAYAGPLTVLIDGGSFSATGGMLDLIHRFHRREGRAVRFLGEAPGVDTRFGWGSGGQSLTVTLPNSRLRLAVPLLGSPNHFGTAPTPVTLPDRALRPDPAELASEADGVLTRALALA